METSHLICSVNQMTGFYMKCSTVLKLVKHCFQPLKINAAWQKINGLKKNVKYCKMPKDKSTKNSNNQMSKIIRTIENLDTKNTLVGITVHYRELDFLVVLYFLCCSKVSLQKIRPCYQISRTVVLWNLIGF